MAAEVNAQSRLRPLSVEESRPFSRRWNGTGEPESRGDPAATAREPVVASVGPATRYHLADTEEMPHPSQPSQDTEHRGGTDKYLPAVEQNH